MESSTPQQRGRVYLLIGIPASGKSTWAEQWAMKEGITVLSSDQIYKENLREHPGRGITRKKVFEIMNARAIDLLRQGKHIVYDASNTERLYRIKNLKIWHEECAADVVGVVMLTDKKTAMERNAVRESPVNPITIAKKWKQLTKQTPIDSAKELFDQIIAIDEQGADHVIYDREASKREGFDTVISPREFTPKFRR